MKRMIISACCIAAISIFAAAELHKPAMTIGTAVEHATHSIVVGDALAGTSSESGHHLTIGQVQGLISVLDFTTLSETMEVADIDIKLYPNPTPRNLYVEHNGEDALTIAIVSLDGKKILNTTSEENVIDLDLGQLPAGIYLLNISTNDKLVKSAKIIKE